MRYFIFGALPGIGACTVIPLSACHLMSHYSLPTNGLVCLFVRPSDHLLQGGLKQQVQRESSASYPLVPGWWNQLGKLTSLPAGAPGLMTSSTLTKMGLWDPLHVCLCAWMLVWMSLETAERRRLGRVCSTAHKATLSCNWHTIAVVLLHVLEYFFSLELGHISHESDLQQDTFESFPSIS